MLRSRVLRTPLRRIATTPINELGDRGWRARRAAVPARRLVHGRAVFEPQAGTVASADAAGRTGSARPHEKWSRICPSRYLSASRRAVVRRPRDGGEHGPMPL